MITKIIHEEKIQKAKKYVEKGESFVIVTHVTPDGDAIGSALGLYHFLTAYGKDNVTVVVPNDFPQFYKWMPGHKEIVIHEKYPDFAEQLMRMSYSASISTNPSVSKNWLRLLWRQRGVE